MTRPLVTATANALDAPVIPLAAIVYLDILADPLFAWTGIGDLTFGAAETGDSSLDGKTFKGVGSIIEVSGIEEGAGGGTAGIISVSSGGSGGGGSSGGGLAARLGGVGVTREL